MPLPANWPQHRCVVVPGGFPVTNWTLVAAPQLGTALFKTYKMAPFERGSAQARRASPDLVPAGLVATHHGSLPRKTARHWPPHGRSDGCAGDKSGGASRDGTKVIARRALHFETARGTRPSHRLIRPPRTTEAACARCSSAIGFVLGKTNPSTPPAHHHRLHPGQVLRPQRVHRSAHKLRAVDCGASMNVHVLRPRVADQFAVVARTTAPCGDRTPSR